MKTYIVQRAVEAIVEQEAVPVSDREKSADPESVPVVTLKPGGPLSTLWEDYSTIDVESRIQRRTIVTRATSEIGDDDLPQYFRAVDPDNGQVIPVRVERPPVPAAKRKVG